MVSGKFLDTISDVMSESLKSLAEWVSGGGLVVNPRKTELVLFTRRKKLDGYKDPEFQGTRLTLSKSARYLGIVLDSRLNWLENVADRMKKAYAALHACQKLVGERWGMKPSLFNWLYTAVIRPVAVYGCHVWWPITNHHNHIQRLGRINRTALIYMTGAMRTTATSALEVLMGICPLDLHIRRTAEVILIRLKGLDSLESTSCRHTELILYAGRHIRTDYMASWHMFESDLESIIPSVEDWDKNRIHFGNLNIYTDGSKMTEGVGSGIYCKELELKESFKLDEQCSIFQAEIFAIVKAAELISMRPINSKYEDLWKRRWASSIGCEQTKLIWDENNIRNSEVLMSLQREDARSMIGIITGHNTFGKHMVRIGLANDDIYYDRLASMQYEEYPRLHQVHTIDSFRPEVDGHEEEDGKKLEVSQWSNYGLSGHKPASSDSCQPP
ncbi:uncharacterized protein LOC142225058 [Haematobia irritans]|uniref:uncharacterized protein LOC142225058 n=1 Tax=Haematobia irritans TaxID=7368 RepID=UPI003F4F9F1D